MLTTDECSALCLQLERNGGAHAHTAGKAMFYLKRIADKPEAKFSNCTADEFVSAVRKALVLGAWPELDRLMGRWW